MPKSATCSATCRHVDTAIALAAGRPRRAYEALALGDDKGLTRPAGLAQGARPWRVPACISPSPMRSPPTRKARPMPLVAKCWATGSPPRPAPPPFPAQRARLASATALWDKANALFAEADELQSRRPADADFAHRRDQAACPDPSLSDRPDDPQRLLRHHRDRLSQRRAAYRPRLRDGGDRRHRPLAAARRPRGLFPHRHRRARPQDGADRRAGRAHDARAGRSQCAALQATLPRRSTSRTTISSAPPRRGISRSAQEIWRRMEAAGDIYQSTYKGWYSVRDEAYFDDERSHRRRGRQEVRAHRRRGDLGRASRAISSASRRSRSAC